MMRLVSLLVLSVCVPAAAQTTLGQFLGLTADQIATIVRLNSESNSYNSGKQQRIAVVNSELSTLYASGSPDPMALGVRYLELEAIRRDLVNQSSTTRDQILSQLNPAQLALLPTLKSVIVLQPLLNDAQCAGLIPVTNSGVSQWFSTGTSYASLLIGGISGAPYPAGLPYIPPAPSGTFCGSTQFPLSVREYLNVTDDQVAAIVTAAADYADYNLRKQDRVTQVQIEIRDETAKATLDPSALGVRYFELWAIGRDLQGAQAKLVQQARAVMSESQIAKLKVLEDSAALQTATAQALACNVIDPPPGSSQNTLISSGCYGL